jgi:hypothetical protein
MQFMYKDQREKHYSHSCISKQLFWTGESIRKAMPAVLSCLRGEAENRVEQERGPGPEEVTN